MKIVFETNVLFAALISKNGFCADVLRATLPRHAVAISQHIVDELRRHLAGKRKLGAADIDTAIGVLTDATDTVVPAIIPAGACRDADDLPVLGTAVAAGADILVSGDEDLLVLGIFGNVRILSPRQFHQRFLSDPEPTG